MQPTTEDLASDGSHRFPIYGPASYLVQYDSSQGSFYSLCEAIWSHWMRVQQEQPDLDPDSIFYWIDLFAMSASELAKPMCQQEHAQDLQAVRLCCVLLLRCMLLALQGLSSVKKSIQSLTCGSSC
jgi:hypothetical protein